MAKKTQKDQIFKYMMEGNTITPVEALREFSCFRLAARISELRDEGADIQSRMVESLNRYGDKIRFKEYRIDDAWI